MNVVIYSPVLLKTIHKGMVAMQEEIANVLVRVPHAMGLSACSYN
jgi:hypothetical protein